MSKSAALSLFAAVAVVAASASGAAAADRDREFFRSIEGAWTGPGELVAGKYKGTKFICNFKGQTPNSKIGVSLDGTCRVGVFSQRMSASIERRGGRYRGQFMDGAAGEGLDVTSGNVDGSRVVMSLVRNSLHGAMLARLTDENAMNVTISVKVDKKLIPVIGMSLKRVDSTSVGSVSRN